MPPRNCLIIPVHNRCEITLRCLRLLAWSRDEPDWHIIVVDDGSTDGTSEAIESEFPFVEILCGNGDLFWTGGIALGMQRAIDIGASVLIWTNDDTSPDEASLRRLSDLVLADPKLVIAPAVLSVRGPFECHSLRRRAVPASGCGFGCADVLAGYQVAFHRDLVEAIGLPNAERWPHYGGDSSFTHTAHKAGFRLRVDYASKIELVEDRVIAPVEEAFWGSKGTLIQKAEKTFFSKQSRYMLRSLWNLDIAFRGILGASVVFPGRLAWWVVKILQQRVLTHSFVAQPSGEVRNLDS